MTQYGAVPNTWRQILFEWYRAIGDKGDSVSEALIEIAREHGHLLDRETFKESGEI